MQERVRVTLGDDGVAEVRLSRPDKLNALDPRMFRELREAGEALCATRGLRAVVMHGEGRAFCAGLDMESMARVRDGLPLEADVTAPTLLERTHGLANAPQRTVLVWRDMPVPVVAAVHGVAYGGGLQVALGADLRFVTPDARMSVMEVRWGLVPDMGGMLLMRELARADVIRELTYTARVFTGEEALAIGFATRVCPDPLAEAFRCAREIAQRSPEAVRAAKRLLVGAAAQDLGALLMAESTEQAALMGSPDQIEAVRANLEQRTPRFGFECSG